MTGMNGALVRRSSRGRNHGKISTQKSSAVISERTEDPSPLLLPTDHSLTVRSTPQLNSRSSEA